MALPPLFNISLPIFDACGCDVDITKLIFSIAEVFFIMNKKRNKKNIFIIDLNNFFNLNRYNYIKMKLKNKITKFFNNTTPIVGLTAYSYDMAKILDKYVNFILVGDSLGMTLYGMKNTRKVTVDMMINHGKTVVKAAKNTLVIVDLPFRTYERSPLQAYETACKVIDKTNCYGIKIEGGKKIAVFGSLLELGAFSQECHFRIGQYALEFVDECHCYGLECQPIVDLWKKKGRLASLHSDFMSLMEVLKKRICSYDVVLLKGSNQKKLWQVIDAFTNEDKR